MDKNKPKMAVSVAVAAKPEVEIWRRPKKSTFSPWFPIHSFRQYFTRTYRFATIQNVTDDIQTHDRQTDDTSCQRHDRWYSRPKIMETTMATFVFRWLQWDICVNLLRTVGLVKKQKCCI